MTGRASEDAKELPSKGRQLTDVKDESFERHKKGINQNIQNIVTRSERNVVEAYWRKKRQDPD